MKASAAQIVSGDLGDPRYANIIGIGHFGDMRKKAMGIVRRGRGNGMGDDDSSDDSSQSDVSAIASGITAITGDVLNAPAAQAAIAAQTAQANAAAAASTTQTQLYVYAAIGVAALAAAAFAFSSSKKG